MIDRRHTMPTRAQLCALEYLIYEGGELCPWPPGCGAGPQVRDKCVERGWITKDHPLPGRRKLTRWRITDLGRMVTPITSGHRY